MSTAEEQGNGLCARYERLLREGEGGQRERAHRAVQFLVDELLAEPEPYLIWLFEKAPKWWQSSPADFIQDTFYAWAGRPLDAGVIVKQYGIRLGIATAFRAPAWLDRMDRLHARLSTAWVDPGEAVLDTLSPRWAGWWIGSAEEKLAVYCVMNSGAPPEDYQSRFWEGDLSDEALSGAAWPIYYVPLAAEFIFRGGPFDQHVRPPLADRTEPCEADLSAVMAHGVWFRREHTWCDTTVGGLDSPSSFTRTARGLLRLPNLCPECERFYRAQIAGRGGLRAFAALQYLDASVPWREEDAALLDDADVMFGDKPVPPSPDDHLFD